VSPSAIPHSFRNQYGDAAIVLFLLAQVADGAFTYVGLNLMGLGAEANPLLLSLIVSVGAAPALFGAKVVAAVLGVALHLLGVHRVVWLLTAVYLAGAVVPWVGLLSYPL
jgi:hypothetical protein